MQFQKETRNVALRLHRFVLVGVLILSVYGCGRPRTPIFIVQTSILAYGEQDILKRAFGEYRYFRNTGWFQATPEGRPAVLAQAKPEINRTLSALKARASRDESARKQIDNNEEKYLQYLATVNYDFIFYINPDDTIGYGGVIVREFLAGKSSIKKYTPDEQALMLKEIAEQKFPTWIERDIKSKFRLEERP